MKDYYQLNNKWICKICRREFNSKQATTSHIYRAHTNPGVSFGGHQKGKPAWNKGLNKQTDYRIAKSAIAASLSMKGKPGRPHSEETKNKISQKLSINNKGGRSKWYEVAGQKVQGTWERNIALKFEELKINWQKIKTNNHTFQYHMDGKCKSYSPDFYLPDSNLYLEIKGYWWGRDKEKMEIIKTTYPNIKILIIEKQQYEKILLGELVW
jgi:hypothetical protein